MLFRAPAMVNRTKGSVPRFQTQMAPQPARAFAIIKRTTGTTSDDSTLQFNIVLECLFAVAIMILWLWFRTFSCTRTDHSYNKCRREESGVGKFRSQPTPLTKTDIIDEPAEPSHGQRLRRQNPFHVSSRSNQISGKMSNEFVDTHVPRCWTITIPFFAFGQ